MTSTTAANSSGTGRWIKRIGVAGFLFFLAKGLVWIGVGLVGWSLV